MMKAAPLRLWTIGHSVRSSDELVNLLRGHQIELLVDVRQFPGSRRLPHFNQANLAPELARCGISYEHSPELGGRRKPRPDSPNMAWRNDAFRGYADYMETAGFARAADTLRDRAVTQRTVMMCAEAVWWRCHRALIADYFKVRGWTVLHIMGEGQTAEHPYTSAARVLDGKLSYSAPQPDLFSAPDH